MNANYITISSNIRFFNFPKQKAFCVIENNTESERDAVNILVNNQNSNCFPFVSVTTFYSVTVPSTGNQKPKYLAQ